MTPNRRAASASGSARRRALAMRGARWRTALAIVAAGALGSVAINVGAGSGQASRTPLLLGAPSDCLSNAFCALGLRQVYGIDVRASLTPLTPGVQTYAALSEGRIGIAVGFSTDPQLSDAGLVQLQDDLRMTGADNVVPVVTERIARAHGVALRRRHDAVSARLTIRDLRALNADAARGRDLDSLARRWVRAERLAARRPAPKSGPALVYVAQAFAESRLLATVYAQAAIAGGYRARVVEVDGFRDVALDALERGRGSIMVDYAASLLEHLDQFQGYRSQDTAAVLALLRRYARQRELRVYAAAPAQTRNVFVVTRATADALKLERLSQLRALGYPRAATLRAPSAETVAARAKRLDRRALTVGARGDVVRRAQARLNALGYGAGAADGIYGELARRAVAWFQQENRLEPNGVLGEATRAALYSSSARRPSKPLAVPGVAGTHDPRSRGNVVYLTFDDGPSEYTSQVKALLDQYGMKATFFMIGQQIGQRRDLVRRLAEDGFAIGDHTWDHTDLSKASTQRFFSEVDVTRNAIRRATGRTTSCLRPPYGATNSRTRSLARRDGFKVVLWDVDPQDWARPGADAIVANVLGHTRAGSIVLMHDGGGERSQTLAALRRILPALRSRGLTSAALDCG